MKKFIKQIIICLIFITSTFNVHAEENMVKNTKPLVVYFSKTGEQYSVGNITTGNTAIIAQMIADATNADVFEVKVKNDNYPTAYKALTEVALQEKKSGARPEYVGEAPDFDNYDVIFVGTPNWWSDMPMVLYTFIEAHNWQNKTVAPFVTHEGSGLSSIPEKIRSATGANVTDGLAVYGHDAQNNREKANKAVQNWLKEIGF